MKNKLHDLSIKRKFAVVLIPLIVTVIVFDYFQIRHNFLDYKDSIRLNKAIIVGIEINHVVHELQKERSISSGYISGQGGRFKSELMDQRRRTDSTLQQFKLEIADPDLNDLMILHGNDIEDLRFYFDRLPKIRSQIDNLTLTADKTIDYFSEINEVALNTVNNLINETRDKELAQQVHAIIYFLKSKEKASMERAVGTKAFSQKEMDYELYNSYSSLVSSQESYLDAFLTITNADSREYYERIVKGPDIEESNRLRNILLANAIIDEDPQHWYNIITAKINLLKKVEDHMSDNIHAYTEEVSSIANRDFWVFLTVDIIVAVLAFSLIGNIVTNLVENVRKLEAFTRRLAAGDMSGKVNIPTKDEIGHYGKTFNVMVGKVNASQQALKKEKDHTQYLYENVIKQSEVVFENVHQGIFLLDKDFKISKLYSKAMEGIFDTKKIAGENYANFMRPHIIPRDLEALEMFMRHLFNTDMDEDVVNQLNPVEQVKIFTETEGIVNTKYIRVSFTRIERDGEIQSIMVTISDETESVLLQKHLEEAEEQKKRETEQVLSILKIDPSVLSGYLHNSKKILKGISARYESNKDEDFTELLNYTFETVHNLKGNSMVIGLDLMKDKFHQIEDIITGLKGREIEGKDFLPILYEIDDAGKNLEDMSEMLNKVANIYKKFPSEGQVVSNIMFVDSLEKGLENMSKEMDKPVELLFKNEKNVVVPENYVTPINDILIQLMRNSLAHGIEESNVRVSSDKMVKGNIIVSLDKNKDNEMIVSYCDDGKGLDLEKIKNRAIQREIISADEAENMEEGEIAGLIFSRGFSTSDKVDDFSGRGAGMGLVKTIIDENEGDFTINSSPGHFFEMNITLPLKAVEETTEEIPS